MRYLIFEETTSPLYDSDDGRLAMDTDRDEDIGHVYVFTLDGAEVMSTRSRTVADAYIAGYDLARGHEKGA